MVKNKAKRYGMFYMSHGRWIGPYKGLTFTKWSTTRNPVKSRIANLRNNVIKQRVKVLPVG